MNLKSLANVLSVTSTSMANWLAATMSSTNASTKSKSAFLLAFVVTAIFYYPALKNNSLDAGLLYTGDGIGLYWPAMAKTYAIISSFNFTAIDFSTFNGSSDYFLAPNFFVLHPLIIVYALLFSQDSVTMQGFGHFLVELLALHSFIACYFSLKLFTRFFSLSFSMAAFVAIAFTFSTNMVGAIGEPQFIFCISVLPWAAYGALAFAEAPSARQLIASSVPVIFALLGGYIPLGAMSLVLSVVLVATKIFALDDSEAVPLNLRLRRMFVALSPYLLASLVVSPYLYAVYEFLMETISANTPSLFYSAHQLAQLPQSLLTLLSPRLIVPGPFYEFSFSAGFIAITIAALFLFSRDSFEAVTPQEWKLIKVSSLIYFVTVLATFGEFSVISDLIYYFIPQIGGMHIYQRFLLPAHLFFALLIAIMLRAVIETRPRIAIKIALVVFALATVAVSYIVAHSTSLSRDIGLDNYVIFELFLGLLFLIALCIPGRRFVYSVAIVLFSLPALDKMYDYAHGGNTFQAQQKLQVMALDDIQRKSFISYLKRFGDKKVIKYVDLTPLWNKDGREPFPKSFPYLVLNDMRLSSYHGFDFRMSPRAEYLSKMPMVVKDGTWVLSPNWDVVLGANADFLIAYESDLKSGALGAFVSKARPGDLFKLPNGIVAVPLHADVQNSLSSAQTEFDNGFFRVFPTPRLVNVARGKPATQSSTFGGRDARLAVDGITNGDLDAGSVSHTDRDVNAWLDIDLGTVETIDSIGIWNVTGCCGFRLRDYWIFISKIPFKPTDTADLLQERPDTWGKVNFTPNPHSVIRTGGVQGRYVRVQLGGKQPPEEAYLHLAEVEVFSPEKSETGTSAMTKAQDFGVKIRNFSTNFANYLRIDWNSLGPSTIQYLFSDNPRISYYLNGERARVIMRNGLVSFDAPAGHNTLEIRYRNWPLMLFWIVFAIYALACLWALAYGVYHLRKRFAKR